MFPKRTSTMNSSKVFRSCSQKFYQQRSIHQRGVQSYSRTFPSQQPRQPLHQPLICAHTDYNSSSSNSRNGSSVSKNSNNDSKKLPKGPRPPGGSSTLPTLDAAPLMSPTLWIKRTSKASHSIAGPDASKRLFGAQDEVCSWIWNKIEHCDKNDVEKGKVGFMVIGHGVPHQLLQNHVDVAWNLLQEATQMADGHSDANEVVECNFFNESRHLDFDWVKLRKRDNTIAKYNASTNTSIGKNENTGQNLYLTVMKRLATTFGTILETQPPPAPSSVITTDKYWKKDIQNPMSCWRATVKRGFDFPPNATSNSFDAESHGGIVKNEGEFWTGHPIVELVPHWARKYHDGGSDHFCDNASLVRVTLQGIPSGLHVRKDDMVPLSLVFEAFFQSDEMRK